MKSLIMKMRNECPLLVSRVMSVNRPTASITPHCWNSHFRVLIHVLQREEEKEERSKKYKEKRKKRQEGFCSLPFPISDIRCPLMCAADTVASRLLLKKLRACWFSAA